MILLLLLAATSVPLFFMARRRYDFVDMSAFMDAGYRIYIGQEPYVDFFYHTGPLHLDLLALFYRLFGFSTLAIQSLTAASNAAAVAAVYGLARRHAGPRDAILAALVTSACGYAPFAHPLYGLTACLALHAGVWWIDARLPVRTASDAVSAGLAGGLAAGVAFMTKTDVGLAGAGMFLAVLLAGPRRGAAGLTFLGGAGLAIGTVLLRIASPADYASQALMARKHFADRLVDFGRLPVLLFGTPHAVMAMVVLFLAWLGGPAFRAAQRERLALFGGMVVASWLMVYTSQLIPTVCYPLAGLEVACLLALIRFLPEPIDAGNTGQNRVRKITVRTGVIAGIRLGAVVLTIYGGIITLRGKAWSWNPPVLVSDYVLQTPALRGWACNRKTGEGFDRAVAAIRERVPLRETLFVFGEATVANGAAGRIPYRRVPFIFMRGIHPSGIESEMFREHFLREPPDWILLHVDPAFISANPWLAAQDLGLDGFIRTSYESVETWGEFTLLRRRRA